jgi:hypothetical protein
MSGERERGRGGWGGDAVGAVPVASIGGGSSVGIVYSGHGYGTECASMVSFFSFFFFDAGERCRTT